MAASDADDMEAGALQRSDNLATGRPRQPGHAPTRTR
jgi:hypothetical protein